MPTAAAQDQLLDQRRDDLAQAGEGVVDAPETAIGLGRTVGDRPHLDRGDAGNLGSAQHAEPLHRLHLGAVGPADSAAGGDRQESGVGECAPGGLDELRRGRGPLDPRQRRGGVHDVAVDGLGPDHHSAGLKLRRAGDPYVENGVGSALGEGGRGRDGGLDRPDPAAERLPVDSLQLPLGGGDDEDHVRPKNQRSSGLSSSSRTKGRTCSGRPSCSDTKASSSSAPFATSSASESSNPWKM